MTDDRVVIGRLGKPHGVRGEVTVRIERDDLSLFAPGVTFPTDEGEVTIARSRRHHGNLILAFEGIGDRDAAEALRGVELTVERSSVGLDDDEWWSGDLIGCRVVDRRGSELGSVTGVEDGVAHALLRLDVGGEALEIPFVDEFVPEVDVQDRAVVVELPDGWWDED